MTDLEATVVSGALLATTRHLRGKTPLTVRALGRTMGIAASVSGWQTHRSEDDPTEPLRRADHDDHTSFDDLVEMLAALPPEAVDRLAATGEFRTLADPHEVDVKTDVWGPAPTTAEALAGELWDRLEDHRSMRIAVESSLPARVIAKRIGQSTRELQDEVATGHLCGIHANGELFLPVWQFTDDLQAHGAVPEMLRLYSGGSIRLTAWMVTSHPKLGGLRPADLLGKGDSEAVLDLLRPSSLLW